MKKLTTALLLIAFALNVEAATSPHSTSVAGIELPNHREGLELHGAGLLRKGLVFKIYVGALYLENDADSQRILEPVPKRLDIHYFQNTPKKHMIRVAEKTLQQNLSAEEYDRIKPQVEQLHNAYLDGPKGGYASLIFRPGEGLRYEVNGRPIIKINHDAFANAYFQVWLGEQPSSVTMKEKLLSKIGSDE